MVDLSPYKDTVSFLMKFFSFIMLYTGDFVLRYYVRFSQIRSQIYYPIYHMNKCTAIYVLWLGKYCNYSGVT